MSAPVRIGGMAPPVFGHGYLYGTDIVAGFGVAMTEFGCLDAPGWMPAGACKISDGELVAFPVQQVAWRAGR